MNAATTNPFASRIEKSIRCRIVVVVAIAAVNWLGVLCGLPDKVVLLTMLVMGAGGVRSGRRLGVDLAQEMRLSEEGFVRLCQLRRGQQLATDDPALKAPVVEFITKKVLSGKRVTSQQRDAFAEMLHSRWMREVGNLKAYASMLVALGVVFTMMSFTIVAGELKTVFASSTVDPSALFSLLPGMASATISSLVGGAFGGVLLFWVAARLEVEVDHYATVVRSILNSYDFGEQ